jgi:mRNA interferase MazF
MPQKYEIWLADLNPRFGTEPGKKRPVVVVQSDLINGKIDSTMVCPLTTKVVQTAGRLRIRLLQNEAGLSSASDILVPQVRAIDNARFIHKIGALDVRKQELLNENLRIVLDL